VGIPKVIIIIKATREKVKEGKKYETLEDIV